MIEFFFYINNIKVHVLYTQHNKKKRKRTRATCKLIYINYLYVCINNSVKSNENVYFIKFSISFVLHTHSKIYTFVHTQSFLIFFIGSVALYIVYKMNGKVFIYITVYVYTPSVYVYKILNIFRQ